MKYNWFFLMEDPFKPYSIFQIYSKLFDPLGLNSHHSWVQIGQFVFYALVLKVGPKFHTICFTTCISRALFENGTKNNLRQSQFSKKRGLGK